MTEPNEPTEDTTALDPEGLDSDGLTPSERRARVVELYRRGLTHAEIGEVMGFSKQRSHQLYWEAMHQVVFEPVDAHRAAMIEELAEVIRTANVIMHKDHAAHSNGRVVVDPDTGLPLTDDGPKLDAGRTIIAAHARLSKLLGADAPTQVETNSTVTTYTVDLGGDGDAAREALT